MRKKSIQDAREERRVVDGDLRSDVQTDVPSSPRFCASRCLVLASEHPDTGRQFALDQAHASMNVQQEPVIPGKQYST